MPKTPATCPLDCADACGVLVESDDRGRLLALRGHSDHGWSRGTLCSKTSIYGELVESPARLLTPLVREYGALRKTSWDAALARIVEGVSQLPGERILAASYAGSMGIVARKFPLRMMHALGAVLTDDGLCDNTATTGYELVLGAPVGLDLEDVDDSDLVVLWGCDMVRTVQHLQPAVQRLCRRGVPAVAVDVYRSDTIRALERWGGRGLVIRPGSDAALALGLARLAYERGYVERGFVERECLGGEAFEEHVRSGHDLAWTAHTTGASEAQISDLADALGAARRPLLKTGVGFTRRRNGGMSMRAVCSLAAVLGKTERLHYESFGSFGLAEDVVERADLRPPGAERAPIRHVELGRELESDRFGALFVWGHNPAVTCPDANRVRAGLAREDLFVVVHEQFRTETAELADVVLPATMFVEHADVYRSYGHRRMHWTQRALAAPEGPRSNVAAFAAIAQALDLPRACWDVTPESLCEELLEASRERITPQGLMRLRAGLHWKMEPPQGPRTTASGRIELFSEAARALGQPPMAGHVPDDGCGDARAFELVSAPSKFTHNSTFSHSPRHLARWGRPVVVLHPDDVARLGLAAGQLARLENDHGRLSLPVEPSTDMPRGLVRVDGLPRACDAPEGVGVNALVPGCVSDLGDGNVLYSTRVDVAAATST
ncbi:MAG TPA: molybdopterin-dependent oxidoreductase [Planctomycetota bacterium]|nr:molybdopterin-dependent oxidoreductase [Planctomycetota bacterium]